jgi:hypothetical protein
MADSDALWSALGIGQLPRPSETRILTFGSSRNEDFSSRGKKSLT